MRGAQCDPISYDHQGSGRVHLWTGKVDPVALDIIRWLLASQGAGICQGAAIHFVQRPQVDFFLVVNWEHV